MPNKTEEVLQDIRDRKYYSRIYSEIPFKTGIPIVFHRAVSKEERKRKDILKRALDPIRELSLEELKDTLEAQKHARARRVYNEEEDAGTLLHHSIIRPLARCLSHSEERYC